MTQEILKNQSKYVVTNGQQKCEFKYLEQCDTQAAGLMCADKIITVTLKIFL